MGLFGEEEATIGELAVAQLKIVTQLPCAILSCIADVLTLVLGYVLIVVGLVASILSPVTECLSGYVASLTELLALKEWWGTEHTVMLIWLALCLPAFWKRSSGNYTDILLQLVSGLSGLMIFGSFVQLATGMQSGGVFGGKFSMPTLALLGVVVMMFGANLEGIKKEIYGYGVNDVPSDEKCALVFDSIKKFIGIETVIFFSIATFGLPSLEGLGAEGYNYTPWLSIFPVCGMVTAMNTYFTPKKVVAEVAPDSNGTPAQPKDVEEKVADVPEVAEEKVEEEKKEPEAEPEAVKEAEGGDESTEKAEEKVEEKVETGPSIICKAITQVKGLLTCVQNVVVSIIGKITSIIGCIVGKITSLTSCVLNPILGLPWNCILSTVICFGTKVTLTYSLWHLTEDLAVFAFPVIDVVVPALVAKAKEKELLTDNTGHIVSESASLVAGCTHYYLFRTYSTVAAA